MTIDDTYTVSLYNKHGHRFKIIAEVNAHSPIHGLVLLGNRASDRRCFGFTKARCVNANTGDLMREIRVS